MSFTEQRAYELLSTAYRAGRFPHALLLIGDETDGANDLALRLLQMANPTTHGDTLESARDAYFRLVRPRSKSRRILIDDIRQIEPFLQQTAPEDRLKVVAILEAERKNEEA
jgi:DNA polymerase-3 subunit delta'